ncbi:MAG: NAD(P)-binding domain-containing protein [Clostridiales bacterium]|nr:NAD(P)-binding domain-containing protein [Clostridiales bacterium]
MTSITGSTTLVIGLGDIGSQFARRMQALGSTVLGIRRMPAAGKPDYVSSVHGLAELDDLLPLADVVALTLPETPQTVHLINRERLARMKPGAVLLNVGRGNAIETEALCDALVAGHLGGAGLDVTDPEPLPADHRLWSLPNAMITPHVSGFYHLQATLVRSSPWRPAIWVISSAASSWKMSSTAAPATARPKLQVSSLKASRTRPPGLRHESVAPAGAPFTVCLPG